MQPGMSSLLESRHIVAAAGEPLVVSKRTRQGRIGGITGPASNAATNSALLRALGTGATVLDAQTMTVAEWDGCSHSDGPIDNADDFRRLARNGRLTEINGAFAAAWLDGDELTLCRDAIGERTLFYARAGESIVFASTLRAIFETELIPSELNRVSVARYLTYAYLPGEETLASGIYEVLPGQMIRFRNGGEIAREQWWQLPAHTSPDAEDVLKLRLRSAIERAVLRRLPPPGEIAGAFLSGGIDSSLVVALARTLDDRPLLTYSVSFGDAYANELPYSTKVAEHCTTRHRIVEITPAATLRHLDESISVLSDPIGDPLTVPNALLFREASKETGIILNGEGGDPSFGGPKNLPMLLAELYGEDALFWREQSYLRAHQKCFDELQSMLAPEILAAISDHALEREIEPLLHNDRFPDFVSRLMAVNLTFKGAHHILPKVDAESFPHGVLARSPLFDREVVEVAFTIPAQLKLRGSIEKYLLKEAVRDLLPDAIVDRPKSGMLVPVEKWFEGPLLAEARKRLLEYSTLDGIIRRDYIERLLGGKLGGPRPRRGIKIWLLVTLESWLRNVLRAPSS